MSGTEYPKIDTLYDRDNNHFVIVGKLRRPEFGNIKRWSLTEKINGRNTKVSLFNNGEVEYGGKTDDAEIPPSLMEFLRSTFTPDKMQSAFWLDPAKIPEKVTVYGEGYGANTNAGSGIYCKNRDVSFRLFDCLIDTWWLERKNLEDIAHKLGIRCVPLLNVIDYLPTSPAQITSLFPNNSSVVAQEDAFNKAIPEGIIARTEPLLFNRKGERVMWKLKFKDFKEYKK